MDSRTFFYDFGKAIYHIDAVYDDFAKNSGVAPTLLWILYALNDGKPHTQREICADWELPKSTVNTVISELKENEYIELRPIKGKRREMDIILTDSGKSYADSLLNELYAREAEAFKELSGELDIADRLERIVKLLKSGAKSA